MSDPLLTSAIEPPAPARDAVSPVVQSAGRWFFWIAGLSLINTVLTMSGSDTSFVMGLAFTLLSDVMFSEMKVVALLIDAVILGFFVFVGLFAVRGKAWAFYLGIVVYVIDALVYAKFGDWMPVAFHALALFFIAKGVIQLQADARATT